MFFLNLLFGLGMLILGYFLMPKPKATKPDAVTELESPTAESSVEISVLFGDKIIKSPNFLGYWDKSYSEVKVESGGKK